MQSCRWSVASCGIVADAYADPEQGSGAVKITPAHDFNDFEVGRRCGLAAINIFDADAAILPESFECYAFESSGNDGNGTTGEGRYSGAPSLNQYPRPTGV